MPFGKRNRDKVKMGIFWQKHFILHSTNKRERDSVNNIGTDDWFPAHPKPHTDTCAQTPVSTLSPADRECQFIQKFIYIINTE